LEIPVAKKLSTVIVGVKHFSPEEEGATMLRNVVNLSPSGRGLISEDLNTDYIL
jgi:hypothetical protein